MDTTNELPVIKRLKFLAFFGLALSFYLLYHHVEITGDFQTSASICSINETFDCDKVAKSEFSEVAGFPVAAFSLFYFLSLFVYLFLIVKDRKFSEQSKLGQLAFFTSLSLPPSIAMLYLSLFVVKAICLFCSLLYLDNFLIAGLSFYYLRKHASFSHYLSGIRDLFRFSFSFKDSYSRIFLYLVVASVSISSALPSLLRDSYFVPRKKAENEKVIDKLAKSMSGVGVSKDQIPLESLVLSDDFGTVGTSSAKINIIEFMDYQCPACKRASEVLKPLLAKYKKEVNLVIKNYPLDESCNINVPQGPHEFACKAASMARCAGGFGSERFWDMHYGLFALPDIDDAALEALPQNLGFEEERFKACLESPATIERIKRDIELGENLRLSSTPTIFLYTKGKLIRGVPVTSLATALEVLLAE